MVIKNGLILNDNFNFEKTDIYIKNDKIELSGNIDISDKSIDATNCYVVPGFIDTHIHGAKGQSFIDFNESTYHDIASYEASMGTTTIVPTLSAAPTSRLIDCIRYLNKFYNSNIKNCSSMEGIHLEGPYFSPLYRGAHKTENIRIPNIEELKLFLNTAHGTIKILTIAPELPNAQEVIEYASKNKVCVSAGHTNATFEDIQESITWGVSQGTHLYNAMRPMKHRDPGAVGALLSSNLKCELIADFFHIDPAVVKITYAVKGKDKINLITDSEFGAGYINGDYIVNGSMYTIKNGKTYLQDGTIGGGTSSLLDNVKNLVSLNIPLEEACIMASKNPAETLGIYDKVGSISKGKQADILILDKDLNIKQVILRGQII